MSMRCAVCDGLSIAYPYPLALCTGLGSDEQSERNMRDLMAKATLEHQQQQQQGAPMLDVIRQGCWPNRLPSTRCSANNSRHHSETRLANLCACAGAAPVEQQQPEAPAAVPPVAADAVEAVQESAAVPACVEEVKPAPAAPAAKPEEEPKEEPYVSGAPACNNRSVTETAV